MSSSIIEIPNVVDVALIVPIMKKSRVIDTKGRLRKLANLMEKLQEFAFDTETNSLKANGPNSDFMCVGISISWGAYNNYYIPVHHRRHEDVGRNIPESYIRKVLKPIFENPYIRKIGHNLKYDMHVMRLIGIEVSTEDIFDTMVASWLCDENTPNGLKENTQMIWGIDQTHFKDVINDVPKEVKKEFGYKATQKVTFDLVLIDDGCIYAMYDAFYTWHCYVYFIDRLAYIKMWNIYFKHYMKFLVTLYNMENRGVTIDIEKLNSMKEEIAVDTEILMYRIQELAGVEFNPSSSVQLSELLYGVASEKKLQKDPDYTSPLLENTFGFRVQEKTESGAPSTGSSVLFKLSKMQFKSKRKQEGVEMCKLLLEYKKLDKLKSAFIDGMEKNLYDDGKVHPNFNIIGTDSGRISCSNPNLQQLPKAEEEDKYQIRSLFIGSEYLADEDGEFVCDLDKATESDLAYCDIKRKKIVAGDFSNLEMRVLAHFSEDKHLLEMFAADSDTHGTTAVNMFELDCKPEEVKKKYPHLRQAAKVINFLLMYGGSAPTLYDNLRNDPYSPIDLGDKTYTEKYHVKNGVEVAQIYIDKYFDSYSGVADFMKRQKRFAHKHKYVLTLLQRKRRLPDINSHDYKQSAYCERLSVNSCIQGSAADITSSAQNIVNNDPWYEEHGVLMLLQVHDELVFECPEKYVEECIRRTKEYMEHPFGPKVELNLKMRADFDSGNNYQQAK